MFKLCAFSRRPQIMPRMMMETKGTTISTQTMWGTLLNELSNLAISGCGVVLEGAFLLTDEVVSFGVAGVAVSPLGTSICARTHSLRDLLQINMKPGMSKGSTWQSSFVWHCTGSITVSFSGWTVLVGSVVQLAITMTGIGSSFGYSTILQSAKRRKHPLKNKMSNNLRHISSTLIEKGKSLSVMIVCSRTDLMIAE